MRDLQRGDVWKRISAYMFDKILLFTVIAGVAYLFSLFIPFDTYHDQQAEVQAVIEAEYGTSLSISAEEYEALSEQDRATYDAAREAFTKNADVQYATAMLYQMAILLITFSVLIGYLSLEFAVPLLFGNGQTFGKKLFGLGVMRIDGVKISPLVLFLRTVLGKYTVETMLPFVMLIALDLSIMGIVGLGVVGAILITNAFRLLGSETHTLIHDLLSSTVCVDLTSQRIFDTPEQKQAYEERLRAERAEQAED